LEGALRGEAGEFERTLSQQFLRYWRSLPGMWKQAMPGAEWTALLPEPKELPEGRACGFDELWDEVRHIATQHLGCQSITGWRGYELRLAFAVETSPQIDQIYVQPSPDVTRERNWEERLGPYVLRLLFRPRDQERWPQFRSETLYDDRWPARLRLHRVGATDQLEVLVGIQDWESCRDTASRRAAIADAFWAGLRVAATEVGLRLTELDKQTASGIL
jgi:hypothetical protein